MVPFTTMCAACTSPSMRASADTTRVPGCSATEATLPRTIPSTRNPPLKITLPSMRVVAPIRLSMRFCGLLVLLNIAFFPSPLAALQAYRVRRARLVRPALVHPYLHALDLRLRVHPEGAFDPAEVLESQPERRRCGVPRLRKGHHSILPRVLQADDELEAPVEVAPAPVGRGQKQQPVAVFARQHVGLDLEAVDGERLRMPLLGCQHLLEHGELFAQTRVVLLERAYLLRKPLLRGALDGHLAVGGVRDGAQARELGLRGGEPGLHAVQFLHHFTAIEAGVAPARV